MERYRRRYQLALGAALIGLVCLGITQLGSSSPQSSSLDADQAIQDAGSDVQRRVEELKGRGASIRSDAREGTLIDIASEVLEEYRSGGDCVLVHAGYLDLSGLVWECTVARGQEVELCFVEEKGVGMCSVHVVCLGPEVAEGLLDVL